MAEPTDDTLLSLEHDHAELHRSVVELGSLARALRAGQGSVDDARAQLIDLVAVLSEDLFGHFSREEEVLFPYVQAAVPELSGEVQALVTGHDAVCGALARLARLAQSDAVASQISLVCAAADRVAEGYTAHARDERALLSSLATRLTPAQRAELTERARGL
ncbi:MAG: hemerythrin domain-containing protein [Polyangiaceae bacterium]|nr:hemerythrin domain-containing protein [Polyangiaceae bacterium]